MTPEQLASKGDESGHQKALFAWAALNFARYPELRWMFAIPNGGKRSLRVAANLKAEGVKAGVPDILLPIPRWQWHALFIELKRPKSDGKAQGRASDKQLPWHQQLQQQGFGVAVCIGWEQARDVIIQYMEWNNA